MLLRIRLITLMRIRTRLFTLMLIRIRIQILALKKTLLLLLRQTDCMGTNRKIVSRMIEEFQHPAIQRKRVQHLGVFFHEIKVR
jgi:hypothetical protein